MNNPPGMFLLGVVSAKRVDKPHIKFCYGAWRHSGNGYYLPRVKADEYCRRMNKNLAPR